MVQWSKTWFYLVFIHKSMAPQSVMRAVLRLHPTQRLYGALILLCAWAPKAVVPNQWLGSHLWPITPAVWLTMGVLSYNHMYWPLIVLLHFWVECDSWPSTSNVAHRIQGWWWLVRHSSGSFPTVSSLFPMENVQISVPDNKLFLIIPPHYCCLCVNM